MYTFGENIQLVRDGEAWAPEICLCLPRHWTIGFFERRTCWGAKADHILFPGGPWLPGESLQAGAWHREFAVTGLRFPCQQLTVTDFLGSRDFAVPTGFIVGALLAAGEMKKVYVVLYLDEVGRRAPRIVDPTAGWLKRQAQNAKDEAV